MCGVLVIDKMGASIAVSRNPRSDELSHVSEMVRGRETEQHVNHDVVISGLFVFSADRRNVKSHSLRRGSHMVRRPQCELVKMNPSFVRE